MFNQIFFHYNWNDARLLLISMAYTSCLSPLVKMNVLLILAKALEKQKLNFSRSALVCMKTRVSLKYFVNDYGYWF